MSMLPHRLIVIAVVNLFLCAAAVAQEKSERSNELGPNEYKSGIIYGKDHAFGLKAPEGWVLDNASGVREGLHAVFYPKGSSWGKSEVVMYANVNLKEKEKNDSFEKIIEDDLAGYREHSPNVKVTDAEPLPTATGKKAVVKYFSGDVNGNYEAVAYVDEEKFVVLLVLTSKTKSGFESSLTAFKQLVGSYLFVSDHVTN
jgi:hypothetical protein